MAKSNSGKQNKQRKPFDFILTATVLVMLALGIVMVLSASAPSALAEGKDSYKYVRTQGLAAFGGIILMYIISKIDYRIYKKFDKIGYGISFLLLLAVLVPGFGLESRWCNEMDIYKRNRYKFSTI